MFYRRMPIEAESPEELGYSNIKYNLAESSVRDIDLREINVSKKILLCYGSHKGKDELRKLIAKEYFSENINNVLVTHGAASALFIIHTTLLNANDEIIVLHPNYATNLETPYAIGCKIKTVELKFENQFNLKAEDVISKITSKTKLVSLTNPHNPTGKVFNIHVLESIISYCTRKKIFVLVDETYKDIPFPNFTHHVLNDSPFLIRVSSLSKAYGVPGIRIGWIYCSNNSLIENFLSAKEQMVICNSVIDEEIAFQILKKKKTILNRVAKDISSNYNLLSKWLKEQNVFDFVFPDAGVVMMPRLKSSISTKKFYSVLLNKHKTYVAPGHCFQMSDHFFRLGFGWATAMEIKKGLAAIQKSASPFI
ncbi:MAG: pyridoxal phosphate-dependent aminotransferase [Bacteroidetes bacterium]|nr:pyridoxal phosphate-dependent aminotransferase [Bacteroidota bacterium]